MFPRSIIRNRFILGSGCLCHSAPDDPPPDPICPDPTVCTPAFTPPPAHATWDGTPVFFGYVALPSPSAGFITLPADLQSASLTPTAFTLTMSPSWAGTSQTLTLLDHCGAQLATGAIAGQTITFAGLPTLETCETIYVQGAVAGCPDPSTCFGGPFTPHAPYLHWDGPNVYFAYDSTPSGSFPQGTPDNFVSISITPTQIVLTFDALWSIGVLDPDVLDHCGEELADGVVSGQTVTFDLFEPLEDCETIYFQFRAV